MKNLFAALIIIFISISGYSQKNTKVRSVDKLKDAGVSAERLNRIDHMLQEAVNSNSIPGAVALISRNGKIVFHKSFGLSNVETNAPLKKDAIFRIASQTKAITSTAVMMLWEEGKFRLDDPISKFIPEFKNAQVLDSLIEKDSTYLAHPVKKPITIRHLITHTSGVGYGFIDGDKRFTKIYAKAGIIDGFTTKNVKIGENVKKLAKLPLHHEPGTNFVYSEGIDILGYLVEITSGMPLDKFFKTRIFDPLGMNDTWFYLPDSKRNRLVAVSEQKEGKWSTMGFNNGFDPDYPINGAKTFFAGGAGLSSTAKDYAIFLQMYLNNGELNGVRLLSRTTVQTIMSNHIGDIWKGSGFHHGLAFRVMNQKGQDKGGEGSEGTFDWGGYFNTQYFADPQEQIIGILMKQTSGPIDDETGWKFRQMVGQIIND